MSAADDRDAFIAGLPKAELHVHHVGSAAPHTVAALAERHAGSTAVPADPDLLADYFTFTDFAHFVTVYLSVVDLLRDPAGHLDPHPRHRPGPGRAERALRRADPHAVLLGDPRDPGRGVLRGGRGRPAAVEAERDITLRWCFDIPGESGVPAGRPDPRHRAGPASGRPGQLRSRRPGARASRGRGSPTTSPRRGPPACTACRTPASRPGRRRSGTRCDCSAPSGSATASTRSTTPRCVEHLAAQQIPLEICPTSNVRTRSVPSLAEHPLPALVAAGVPVSISSDDPPMFSTDLTTSTPWPPTCSTWTHDGLAELARAAVRQSFADEPSQATDPGRDRRLRRATSRIGGPVGRIGPLVGWPDGPAAADLPTADRVPSADASVRAATAETPRRWARSRRRRGGRRTPTCCRPRRSTRSTPTAVADGLARGHRAAAERVALGAGRRWPRATLVGFAAIGPAGPAPRSAR